MYIYMYWYVQTCDVPVHVQVPVHVRVHVHVHVHVPVHVHLSKFSTSDFTLSCVTLLLLFVICQELASGEPVLVDLNEESEGEEQDFDSWEPDPVDADPSKCKILFLAVTCL